MTNSGAPCSSCHALRRGVENALRRADTAEAELSVARAQLAQVKAELRLLKKPTTADAFEAATDRGPGEAR